MLLGWGCLAIMVMPLFYFKDKNKVYRLTTGASRGSVKLVSVDQKSAVLEINGQQKTFQP